MVTIHVATSERRRSQIRMRVTGKNELMLDVPLRTPVDLIADLISQHTGLLKKATTIEFRSIPTSISPSTPIFLWGIEFQAGSIITFGKRKSLSKMQFYDKVSEQLECEIVDLVSRFRSMMSISRVGTISLKLVKSQWGSCSSRGNLSFNKRLIHYPKEIIEYVVIHELAHIHQHNHSKAFWQIVKQFYPDYKEAKKVLRSRRFG